MYVIQEQWEMGKQADAEGKLVLPETNFPVCVLEKGKLVYCNPEANPGSSMQQRRRPRAHNLNLKTLPTIFSAKTLQVQRAWFCKTRRHLAATENKATSSPEANCFNHSGQVVVVAGLVDGNMHRHAIPWFQRAATQ